MKNFNSTIAMVGGRQARLIYGPLFGFLMGIMFSRASAKYPPAAWYVSEEPPHYNEEEYYSQWQPIKGSFTTTIPESYNFNSALSGFGEETAAASNVQVRRRTSKPSKSKRRRTNTKPKRRRVTTTTTEAFYYDDNYYSDEYEQYSEEVRPLGKRRKATTPAYEDYDDYSVEATTKPAKRRKKPSFNSASLEIDDLEGTTRRNQAQSLTTTTETTTTEETTTANMTISTTTFAGYNGTNLHDNITFTYGPPTANDPNLGPSYTNYGPPSLSRLDYAPFINWYNQFKSRNDIVKRVQDIVGEDDFTGFADLQ